MSLRSIIAKSEADEARRLKKQLDKIDRLYNDPKEVGIRDLLKRLMEKINREKEERNDN